MGRPTAECDCATDLLSVQRSFMYPSARKIPFSKSRSSDRTARLMSMRVLKKGSSILWRWGGSLRSSDGRQSHIPVPLLRRDGVHAAEPHGQVAKEPGMVTSGVVELQDLCANVLLPSAHDAGVCPPTLPTLPRRSPSS